MPIDWGNRETIFRLLAAAFAVIGKEGFKGTYAEIARLFGEPATYHAIQCQFREVSKMADGLRAGQVGTHNRQRSVKAPKAMRRLAHLSSNLDPGDLEVVAQGREGSAPDGAPGLQHQGKSSEDPEFLQAARSRDQARPSLPPSSSTSSSEARTIIHNEQGVHTQPAPVAPIGMREPAKLIPKVIITSDQVDRPHYRVVPFSSSTDEVTASFEKELIPRAASAARSNETEERASRSSLGHAEERARFRKLYSSDSHGTRAERVDVLLNQNSQEHAAERARYRKLYFPDQDKDPAAVWQGVSEAHSAASAQDQQGPKLENFLTNAPGQTEVPVIARFVGKKEEKDINMDTAGSSDHLTETRKNNASPFPDEISNHNPEASIRSTVSYMDRETWKCLLCDGRRIPGLAFYKHERGSQRHRDNLKNEWKVAKANARMNKLISKRTQESAKRTFGIIYSPSWQDVERRSQERSKALPPDQLGHNLSHAPQRQRDVASAMELSSQAKCTQSMQHATTGEILSGAEEAQSGRDPEDSKYAPPLKRKRPVLEPDEDESSALAMAKQAKRGDDDSKTRDDILVQISSSDLAKLLKLHPDIFDGNWNQRDTPTPSGWQAMGPTALSKPQGQLGNTAYRRQADGSDELHIDANHSVPRDDFQYSSRCDDSEDSDYQDEEGAEEDDDDDDEEEEQEEEEEEEEDDDDEEEEEEEEEED